MESWRLIFREAIAPKLAEYAPDSLAEVLAAIESDDPRMTQGSTTTPPPLMCVQDWPVEAGCVICFAGWQGGGGCTTVGEAEEFFAKVVFEADEIMGEPAGSRWFLNWFDDTPRPEMRRELAAELRFILGRGPDPMEVPAAALAAPAREVCPF